MHTPKRLDPAVLPKTQLASSHYIQAPRAWAVSKANQSHTADITSYFISMPTNVKAESHADNKTSVLRKRTRESTTSDLYLPSSKKRSTTKQRAAADPYNPENHLEDSLRPGLDLVFIGLNPGLTTAAKGHAYAHPSNHFWKLLHQSGITPVEHKPSDTYKLPDLYSIGNTNICARATRSGDGLSKQELLEGAKILEEKIGRIEPEAVCIVGKGIWDTIYKFKTGKTLKAADFSYGWQDEKLWLGRGTRENNAVRRVGSRTFVATSTSGLAANLSTQQKLEIWRPLGQWVQDRRNEPVKSEHKAEIDQKN